MNRLIPIDSIIHAPNSFQKLTDILAAHKDVTVCSFISLLRFIYELTSADEEDNATSTRMSNVIRDYIASNLITVEDDEAQRQLNWPKIKDVKTEVLCNHTHLLSRAERKKVVLAVRANTGVD